MPTLNMTAPHALGQDEALRRIKERIDGAKGAYGDRVSDLREQWNDHELTFAFTAARMKIAGKVTIEPAAVRLTAEVPWAAMLMKGMIERQVRQQLGDLLA